MQIGLCTISNKEASAEEVLETAAAAGYDGVEIWGRDHAGDGSVDTCEAIAETAADLGLETPVYGSYLAPGTDGFDDACEAEVAAADRLGADLIRVWPGESEYEDCTEDEWGAAVEDLAAVSERAAAADLAVTVEKHEGRLSNTTDGARRLIEAVDHPHCGLNWQPLFHMSETDLLAEAERLAPLSNNVHIQAPAEKGGSERVPLEDAYFDVGAVLERFESAGFDGYVEVEFVSGDEEYERAVRRDRDYLRNVLAGDEREN